MILVSIIISITMANPIKFVINLEIIPAIGSVIIVAVKSKSFIDFDFDTLYPSTAFIVKLVIINAIMPKVIIDRAFMANS